MLKFLSEAFIFFRFFFVHLVAIVKTMKRVKYLFEHSILETLSTSILEELQNYCFNLSIIENIETLI